MHFSFIASYLLQSLINDLGSELREIELHVHVLNTIAFEFYVKKFNFTLLKIEKNYYLKNRGVSDPPDAFHLTLDRPSSDPSPIDEKEEK